MHVFIAGATGVLGRRTVAELRAAGHEVTAVARTRPAADRLAAAGARPVLVDLFDAEALTAATRGHDAAINLATRIPPAARAWRRGAWRANDRLRGRAAGLLAAAARDAEVVVQESIALLYADGGPDLIDETRPVEPAPATASALVAEAAAHAVTSGSRRGIVLRFGLFVAPDSIHTREQLRWATRGQLTMLGDPRAHISLVDADDAARAVVAALDAPAGTYNVCEDHPATRAEHAEALGRVVGRRLRHPPRWPGRTAIADPLARSLRVDASRLRETTGWRPHVPELRSAWPQVLARTRASERHHLDAEAGELGAAVDHLDAEAGELGAADDDLDAEGGEHIVGDHHG